MMKSYNLNDMRKRVKTMTTKLNESQEKVDELTYLIAYLHMGMNTMKVDSDTEEEQPVTESETEKQGRYDVLGTVQERSVCS